MVSTFDCMSIKEDFISLHLSPFHCQVCYVDNKISLNILERHFTRDWYIVIAKSNRKISQ